MTVGGSLSAETCHDVGVAALADVQLLDGALGIWRAEQNAAKVIQLLFTFITDGFDGHSLIVAACIY